ncbi:MAG: sigma-70 family RNA polymerase sigma factor [Gammaproteobacteria bacterium]|nr:sigma-70 family RNA polymerase sigma factor [Gammaproteobacteria bacterium]
MTQTSDDELVRRFQRGDGRAFEALVERHQDRIFRLATAMLRSRDDAADAAQEVFLRAYQGLPRFRFGAAPFTWMYRTLRHVCSELNRRERAGERPAVAEPASTVDAGVALDAERRLERVLANVAVLPERQRDVLLLRVFEGMSVAETARALGCRPGTVKAQLHRALARLEALEPAAFPHDEEKDA